MVDDTDWRVSRPAMRPAVRATEPAVRAAIARPVATESRTPNLFQRITGAFATPKTAVGGPVAAEVSMPASRAVPENVVIAAKPAMRPAPVQTSIDVTERAKPAREDDDLQIPAFLRRQAN